MVENQQIRQKPMLIRGNFGNLYAQLSNCIEMKKTPLNLTMIGPKNRSQLRGIQQLKKSVEGNYTSYLFKDTFNLYYKLF